MNVEDVASILGMTRAGVYKMIKERRGPGTLFYYVPGMGYKFGGDKVNLETYLKEKSS